MLSNGSFTHMWGTQAYIRTEKQCWDVPADPALNHTSMPDTRTPAVVNAKAFFRALRSGANCKANWCYGANRFVGSAYTRTRGAALVGFDEDISRTCMARLPISEREQFGNARGWGCKLANYSILNLFNDTYNSCPNLEWIVCAAMGELRGQSGIRLASNSSKITPFAGPHRFKYLPGHYTNVEVVYLELCVLSFICTNGADLFVPSFRWQPAFRCLYSAAKLDELEALVVNPHPHPARPQPHHPPSPHAHPN